MRLETQEPCPRVVSGSSSSGLWRPGKGFPASGTQAGGQRGLDPREDGKNSRGGGLEGWGSGGWASGWASSDLRPGPESRRSLSAAYLWSDPLVWQFRLGVVGWRVGGVSLPGSGGGGGEVWLLMGVRVEETRWTHPLSLRGHWVRSSGGLGPFLSSSVRHRRGSMSPGLCCPLPLPVGICQGTDLQKLGWVWLSGHGLLVQG